MHGETIKKQAAIVTCHKHQLPRICYNSGVYGILINTMCFINRLGNGGIFSFTMSIKKQQTYRALPNLINYIHVKKDSFLYHTHLLTG